MRKLMVATSAAALLALSSLPGLAAETTGVITTIDAAAGTVTLNNGGTYKLPENFDAAELPVGQQVSIEFFGEAKDGAFDATSIEVLTVGEMTDETED